MDQQIEGQIRLPQEIWYEIFHYIAPGDCKEISLTCSDFKSILQNNALWRHYIRKAHPKLSLQQINASPDCRQLYTQLLHAYGWAIGYRLMRPGTRKLGEIGFNDGMLEVRAISDHSDVWLRLGLDHGKLVLYRCISEMGDPKIDDIQNFLKQNIVVFFFDCYQRIDPAIFSLK